MIIMTDENDGWTDKQARKMVNFSHWVARQITKLETEIQLLKGRSKEVTRMREELKARIAELDELNAAIPAVTMPDKYR